MSAAAAAPALTPWSGLALGLGQGLGGAMGGGGPFMGGASEVAAYGTTLDGAGWIVNIGGGRQDARADITRTTDNSPVPASQAGVPFMAQQAGVSPVAILAAVGLGIAALIAGRKRK